ncbi:MAG: marine proteobacterial sortase target protein, partial [Nitrospira sp.]
QAVLDVALPHHLVSKYTSLVAVDVTPVRPLDKTLQAHAMKTNLPDGQDYQAIFGLPQTATSGQLQILLGLATLLAARVTWAVRASRKRVA